MENNDISVYEVPRDRRVWVVRASGGDFVRHFRQDSVAAIGHLDILDLQSDGNPFFPDTKDLSRQLQTGHGGSGDKPSRTASAHMSQVKYFIFEMNVGDLVITIDSDLFSIGRVIGDPYIDKNPVRVIFDAKKDRWTEMKYELRRKVNWGPLVKRKRLPYVIERSFSAHQTVFNLDKSIIYIHHLLYPVFIYNDALYFSAKIKKESNIDNYSMSQFLGFLSEMAILSKGYSDGKIDALDDFNKVFEEYRTNGIVDVTTKAAFMSPGDIWGQVMLAILDHKDIVWFYVCWSAVFGSKPLGWKGAINNQNAHKLASMAVALFNRRGGDSIRNDLEIDVPKYDTKNLEDDSLDKPSMKSIEQIDKNE